MLKKLTIPRLKIEATAFAAQESTHAEPSLFGVTDGKAVGTYLEQKFQANLHKKYNKEFGDFQTPQELATKVTSLVSDIYGNPDLVVEPTAGIGSFLNASNAQWGKECQYEGYEINQDYVARAYETLKTCGVKLFNRDFFTLDWKQVLNRTASGKVLVLGNPPWVTNSELGLLEAVELKLCCMLFWRNHFFGIGGLCYARVSQ